MPPLAHTALAGAVVPSGLAGIPGLSEDPARSIIAGTGLDMSRFATAGHPGPLSHAHLTSV
jgi:hypothetical protein